MFKNLFFNIGSKVIVILSQFTALILTNHIIGPEGRGVFLAAITWCSTFYIFSSLSLSTGILNLANKDILRINNLAYTSTIAAFLLGLGAILALMGFYNLAPDIFNRISFRYLLITFCAIPFMLLQQYGMAVVQSKGNFRAFNLMYAAYAVVNVLSVLIIWLLHKTSLELLIFINLFAWFVTGLTALYYLWPFIQKRSKEFSVGRSLLTVSVVAHLGPIVSFILTRSDILIVNYFTNERQTGIYGLAVGIVQILLIVPLSLQNILYHKLMGKSLQEQRLILLQFTRITFTVVLLCTLGIWVFSTPLVYIVGGKNFAEAIPLLKYFLPGILFYSIPMIMAAQWNLMGIFKQINLTSIVILLISVLSNIILIPKVGITGGAITFEITTIITLFIHIWFFKNYLGKVTPAQLFLIQKSDIKMILNRG